MLPIKVMVDIAKCDWRLYGNMLMVCKELNTELKNIDAFTLFTHKNIANNKDTGEKTVYWVAFDGVEILRVVNRIGGPKTIYLQGCKYMVINRGMLPYINDNGETIYPDKYTYNITTYDINGHGTRKEVNVREWRTCYLRWSKFE
jgi:hypothetical protein